MSELLTTNMLALDGGIMVRHATLGSGPAVVMTHGYPDNLQIWSRVACRLADRFAVHAFDWPGLGHSAAFNGGATPYHLAEHLRLVVDALDLERVHVVGLDMGAQPALVLAARHPERVDRIVVTNSLVAHDAPTSWDIRVMRNLKWNAFVLRHASRVVFARALWTFLPRGASLPSDVRGDLWRGFRRSESRDRLVRMCAGYQASLPRLVVEYESIAAPLCAMWGRHDSHFPPAQAEALCRHVQNAKTQVIDGPHWMAWSHSDIIAAAIAKFFSE